MVQRKRKKRSKLQLLFPLVLLILFAALTYRSINFIGRGLLLDENRRDKPRPAPTQKEVTATAIPISFDNLYSPHAILVDLDDETILMQKKSDDKIYPASLTKMMTILVAIENLDDFQEEIKLGHSMFENLTKADASIAGFQPGERVRAIDLLYGAMLPSGAECSIGLADYIAGSESAFVKLMNEKAADLGMDNTHFANATGLHKAKHVSTVKDMSVLLCYALQNDMFRKIFTAERYSTSPTNIHPDGITFYSTMFSKVSSQSISDGKILGGKTGFTREAGLCLASLAVQGGKEYILVTAGAPGDHQSEQYNVTDAFSVYNSLVKK